MGSPFGCDDRFWWTLLQLMTLVDKGVKQPRQTRSGGAVLDRNTR